MLEISIFLLIKAIVLNIVLPLLPGILLMILVFRDAKTIRGRKLYLVSRFLGVGIIANWMFDIQFIRFGIGIREYIALVIILLAALFIKVLRFGLRKNDILDYLRLEKISGIKESYLQLPKIEKIITIACASFISRFFINSFVHTANFPIYADDSFGNWDKAAVNIYYDNGIKLRGDKTEILGRGNVGYPIHIAAYKATLGHFMGGRFSGYMKFFQWFGLFFIVILGFIITFQKTKNILYSVIPGALICGLPLVFRHAIDGYHELVSAYYAIVSTRLLSEYFNTKQPAYLSLGSIFLWILCYAKNDGLAIYMPSVALGFVVSFLLQKNRQDSMKQVLTDKKTVIATTVGILLLLIPFSAVKLFHGLGLNPTESATSSNGITTHPEIFKQFKPIFFQENNYNVALIFVILLCALLYFYYDQKTSKKEDQQQTTPVFLFILPPVTMFLLFTAVFFLTENYQWMMSQTTSNRVYTMCFVILFYFFGIIIDELQRKK